MFLCPRDGRIGYPLGRDFSVFRYRGGGIGFGCCNSKLAINVREPPCSHPFSPIVVRQLKTIAGGGLLVGADQNTTSLNHASSHTTSQDGQTDRMSIFSSRLLENRFFGRYEENLGTWLGCKLGFARRGGKRPTPAPSRWETRHSITADGREYPKMAWWLVQR
jgi:hypothetical protein